MSESISVGQFATKSPCRLKFVLLTGFGVLIAYLFVYILRKSFTASTYDGLGWGSFSFKIIISVSQILGYLLSKFIGIKLISELKRRQRFPAIVISALGAEIALLLFALIPYPYNFWCLFINGLFLGCMWGFLFSYIEGRYFTDVLASFLGVSIVISSGAAKSLGLFVMSLGIDQFWMPAVLGAFACLGLIMISFGLDRMPDPSPSDIQERSIRKPLNKAERKELFRRYVSILLPLFIVNILYTVLRDIKEDFLVDIVKSTSIRLEPFLFVKIDSLVTVILLVLLGSMFLIKQHRLVIHILFVLMLAGSGLIFFTSTGFESFQNIPILWLFLQSLGIYTAYLAFQTIFFDRFISLFKIAGNVGFFIYLSDFLGYLASCVFLLLKSFFHVNINWLQYYNKLAVTVSVVCALAIILAFIFLNKKVIYNIKSKQAWRRSSV